MEQKYFIMITEARDCIVWLVVRAIRLFLLFFFVYHLSSSRSPQTSKDQRPEDEKFELHV